MSGELDPAREEETGVDWEDDDLVGTRNSLAPSGDELSKTGVSTSVNSAQYVSPTSVIRCKGRESDPPLSWR